MLNLIALFMLESTSVLRLCLYFFPLHSLKKVIRINSPLVTNCEKHCTKQTPNCCATSVNTLFVAWGYSLKNLYYKVAFGILFARVTLSNMTSFLSR